MNFMDFMDFMEFMEFMEFEVDTSSSQFMESCDEIRSIAL